MAGPGKSLTDASGAVRLAHSALDQLVVRRGTLDHPARFLPGDNPWTDQLARLFRDTLNDALAEAPDPSVRHVVAANWRTVNLLAPGPADAARAPLYDLAWRVYSEDCSQLLAQPLIAECAWRGGWAACAPACDRLAQGAAGVRLLCVSGDPQSPVAEMTLAEACAFRIAAFAPKDETVLLAFYGGEDSWRESAGFSLYTYQTGQSALTALNPES